LIAAWWVLAAAPCVVLDAGHGGSADAGATFELTKEKDVALAVVRRIEEPLAAKGIGAVLTRESDQTLSLPERASAANASGCVALVSVHFNASVDAKLSGVETYYLDTLKNRLPARIADIAHAKTGREPERAEVIVRDLRMRAQAAASGELAVRTLGRVLTHLRALYPDTRDNGARHDLFELLASTDMPAIIVEAGYLTNPEERAHLAEARYQSAIAAGIAEAVSEFVRSRSP
jgi:N-acetylmuramoyl-L-alanine amidase